MRTRIYLFSLLLIIALIGAGCTAPPVAAPADGEGEAAAAEAARVAACKEVTRVAAGYCVVESKMLFPFVHRKKCSESKTNHIFEDFHTDIIHTYTKSI